MDASFEQFSKLATHVVPYPGLIRAGCAPSGAEAFYRHLSSSVTREGKAGASDLDPHIRRIHGGSRGNNVSTTLSRTSCWRDSAAGSPGPRSFFEPSCRSTPMDPVPPPGGVPPTRHPNGKLLDFPVGAIQPDLFCGVPSMLVPSGHRSTVPRRRSHGTWLAPVITNKPPAFAGSYCITTSTHHTPLQASCKRVG